MSDYAATQTPMRPTLVELTFEWFQRIVAAYCLLFGVFYWMLLIGYYQDSPWRFDLMPVHWQIASATLAVLFPFAAIGLWTLASWGPVIWFICAAAETVMYAGLPDLFGQRLPVVLCHLGVALLYVTFRLVLWLRNPRAD